MGLVVGSFLNVVVARLPKGKSLVRPRSQCPKCKKQISWYDNVPVFSYLFLRGKCRACKTTISPRYPVIELLTGMLFLAALMRFGWSWSLVFRDWPFLALLVAIAFIDLEHRIIPDPLSLGGLGLGLATCWLGGQVPWLQCWTGAAFGFSVFYALAWAYQHWSGRSGLGGGDVKLLAMIGAFLGPGGVFATIFISSVVGSIVGIGWALATKRKDVMKLSVPYGPFLVVGAIYYYLLGDILWFQFMTPM
ncbi:MAG: prepilin peptidase [Bdellovibrio sp.]|nr:prepilin peptidase [Bdellovibrio sp.]